MNNEHYTQLEFPFCKEFPPPAPAILDYTLEERLWMVKNEPELAAQLVFEHFREEMEK